MLTLVTFLLLIPVISSFELKPFKCPTSLTPGWHPLGFTNSFRDRPKRVEFNNEDGGFKALVVWKQSTGGYLARPDVCAHLGAKLSKGKIMGNGCIQCPYHGLQFGPNAAYEEAREMHGIVHEENGLLWWNKDPNEKYKSFCSEIRNFRPGDVVTRWEMEVKASFSDCYRNSMDLHHAGYVHESTFGNKARDPDGTEIKWLDERTMRADFYYYSNDNYKGVTGEKTSNYHVFQQPSTTWNKVLNQAGDKYVFIHVAMRPTSPTTTKWYVTGSSNYMPDMIPNEISEYMMKRITQQVAFIEDKTQLESMETEDMKEMFAYKIILPLDDIYDKWYKGPSNDELFGDPDGLLFRK